MPDAEDPTKDERDRDHDQRDREHDQRDRDHDQRDKEGQRRDLLWQAQTRQRWEFNRWRQESERLQLAQEARLVEVEEMAKDSHHWLIEELKVDTLSHAQRAEFPAIMAAYHDGRVHGERSRNHWLFAFGGLAVASPVLTAVVEYLLHG